MDVLPNNTICIRPFKTIAITVAALTFLLLCANFLLDERENLTEYLLFSGYCIAMIYWAFSAFKKKIIFSANKVVFHQMAIDHDLPSPSDLCLSYADIHSVCLVGDHLFIHSVKGKISLPLKLQEKVTTELKAAFEAHGIDFETNPKVVNLLN